ncbi:MAG: PQQ-binding-like beta-propeller repeat protein, partial [Candidatus Thermoplasmatota archaeon]
MRSKKNKIIKYMVPVIILLNLFSINFPMNASAAPVIDKDDGFWFDTFQDNSSVHLKNCTLVNQSIVLSYNTTNYTYNFKSSEHKSYTFNTIFFVSFFSPSLYSRYARELTFIGYSKIRYLDNNMLTTESTYLKRVAMHLFRIKIKQKEENINQISIAWHGKASSIYNVKLYQWQSITKNGEGWKLLSSNTSDGAMITLEKSITSDFYMSDDQYLDICVVASAKPGSTCTLSTDYIEVKVFGEGYATIGTATSNTISPSKLFLWEGLITEEYTPPGTSIKYQFLYSNNTLIKESLLPGNKNGFKSPVNLTSPLIANITSFKIKATLTTDNPAYSPRIYSWGLLWQTQKNKWRDLYNSTLRVDDKDKVEIIKGNATLTFIYDDWCMLGQNPANTRASDGAGAKNDTLYWYSPTTVKIGGGYKNPVIKKDRLYISSSDGKRVYIFNTTVPPGKIGDANSPIATIVIPEHIITNTPAVTDDLIIVATGNTSKDGVENKIYVYDHSYNLSWSYQYPGKICYSASPVISDQTIYITSWSGDKSLLNFDKGNNKILAISINTKTLKWSKNLPAGSFSTPSVSHGRVIVGCDTEKNYSLYAYDSTNGELLWQSKVGSVRYASPVIYKDRVYVITRETVIPFISARTKLVAVDIDDGRILYNVTLGGTLPYNLDHAVSNPCVYDNVLYAASPDGSLYAINIGNGEIKWSKKVYTKDVLSTHVLTSSPCYADSLIYIGTPDGSLLALHSKNGSYAWNFSYTEGRSPVHSSPVVANGVVYFTDEDGVLYSLGYYNKTKDRNITGSLTSIPVRLPNGYRWNGFHLEGYNISTGASISYSILDESYKVIIPSVVHNENISSKLAGYKCIRLRATFNIKNVSQKTSLYGWSISLQPTKDNEKPVFIYNSFIPSGGYTNTKTPSCSIKVYDNGTGLNVKTSSFTLEYKLKNQTSVKTYTGNASCTGVNASTKIETISINISTLTFSKNITGIIRIRFYISDMNGNGNYSQWYQFKNDTVKPSSSITNKDSIPFKCNMSVVVIKATASDTGGSGVVSVGLYYKRNSSTTYKLYSVDTSPPYNFSFTINISDKYDLCTIATDNAGNIEDQPSTPDITFIYDKNKPSIKFEGGMIWLNSSDSPIPVTFHDDYKLNSIDYRVGEGSWSRLASDINKSVYSGVFVLPGSIWGSLEEGR